jgi:outer membrane protein assembly factor BamB
MRIGVLIGSVLVLGGSCLAEDWPRWRGPEGTGHVPAGVAVPKTLPGEPNVLWRVKIGDGAASPVVAAGGKVYYLDHQQGKETVHAADASSGKELWGAALDEVFKDFQSLPGPRCTPLVDGQRLYVQSCRGEFQCLGVGDGKPLWRVNFVKDFGAVFFGETGPAVGASRHGYAGSAVVDGDRIFVGVGGTAGASVVCFNKQDGKVIWKSQNDVPGFSALVVATIAGVKQVVSFTAEGVIGLDIGEGKLLWRSPVKTALGRHVTTPVVVDDVVVVGSHQAGLIGIKVSKQGAALSAERAWTIRNLGVNFSSPVAVGGYVYGIGPASALFCVDPKTGEKAWVKDGFFSDSVKTGYASFMVMNDNLLILADGGQLFMVAADPKQCRTVAKTRVCGQNWCSPAYADGKLFLRDAKELLCIQLMP